MIRSSYLANFLVLFVLVVAVFTSKTQGGLIASFETSSASQTAFPVSSSDLINIGAPSLLGYSATNYNPYPNNVDQYGPITSLIDGSSGGYTGFNTYGGMGGVMDIDGYWEFQVDLNTTLSPNGYDISEINTFTGHEDNRKSQAYKLFFSTVGDSFFSELGEFRFNYDTPNPGATKLSITSSDGFVAKNVDSIRWEVLLPSSSGAASVYREFDVFGVASVPEPSCVAIFGLGTFIIGSMRFREPKRF